MEKSSERFYLLDICRVVAAFGVILWHWQHFYLRPGSFVNPGGVDNWLRTEQPFYNIFWVFYEHGFEGVKFFYCLSGFIFFWLYLENIRNNRVNLKSFFILRFSRLYPLHFATLIFVLIFQAIFLELNGNLIIYPFFDLKHFLLNLGFISYWGFEDGHSFNGPNWSVSLEILAYCIFFVFAVLKLNKLWQVIIVLLLTYPLSLINESAANVIFGFFVGGGTFLIFDSLEQQFSYYRKHIIFLVLIVVIGAKFFIYDLQWQAAKEIYVVAILSPGIILILALLQRLYINLGREISKIGDLSYGIYLTHFPLQLILIGSSQYFNYQLPIGNLFFIGFFIVLVLVSHLLYRILEIPAQQYIRRRFLK